MRNYTLKKICLGLIIYLLTFLYLYGQEQHIPSKDFLKLPNRNLSDSTLKKQSSSLSNANKILFKGPGIVLYDDYFPSASEVRAEGGCTKPDNPSSNFYSKCGAFTVPENHSLSIVDPQGWVFFDGLFCGNPGIYWSLQNSAGEYITEKPYVIAGQTYKYCLETTTPSFWCSVSSICLSPSLIKIEPKLEHYYKNDNQYKLLQEIPDKSLFFPRDYFAVCADGSDVSEFRLDMTLPNLRLRIKEDINAQNKSKYGIFSDPVSTDNGLKFTYNHPSLPPSASDNPFEEFTIELFDSSNSNGTIKTFNLRVYRAPLLMIHGLKSDASSFRKMRDYLYKDKKYYTTKNIALVDYEMTNTKRFEENKTVVPVAISAVIENILKEKIALKKVDLVGHSMGGILSRLYQQSAVYKYDINRIITICTPHSGSHIGDLINDPNFSSTPFAPVACWFLNCGGAINNLSVGRMGQASIIDNDLNGSNRLNNPVPSHAITSTQNLATGSPDMRKAWYYLDTTPNTLFGESNDLIVPLSSQQGGLPIDCRTDFTGQEHVGAQAFGLIINRVAELLGKDPNVNLFCKTGFNPPDLNYTPLPNGLNNALIAHSLPPVIITSPSNNKIINRNSQITITASCEQATKMSIYIKKSQTDISIHEVNASTFNINVVIDSTYSVGEHEFLVVAEFGNGQISYAESKFTVTNCVDNYNPLVGEITNPYYQAKNKIVASGQLFFGQPVVMTAGQSIEFKPGFVADTYTLLDAQIKRCDNE